jgi:hypothetical protein
LVKIGCKRLVLKFEIVVGDLVSEVRMVLRIGGMMLDGVFEVVDVDGLDVELVVVVLYFFQVIMIGFAGRFSVELIAELVQIFPVTTQVVAPLLAF